MMAAGSSLHNNTVAIHNKHLLHVMNKFTEQQCHVPLLLRHNRGFFHQCTDLQGLDKKLCEGTGADVSAYLGFDATADSLHVGSLTQIMILRHLQVHISK
jgi:hypothetical protein